MKKIFNLFSKIEKDKLLHFSVSSFLCLLFSFIFSKFMNNTLALTIGSLTTLTVGVAKEIYDQIKYKGFDWKDIVADILGILYSCGIFALLKTT